MKRLVNGEEIDLHTSQAHVSQLNDRLLVRTSEGSFSAVVVRKGDADYVSFKGQQFKVEPISSKRRVSAAAGSGEMRAPMPGLIVDVRVNEGQAVQKGDVLVVLEAMKTQQPFIAPYDGTVKLIGVQKGQQVSDADVLVIVERQADKLSASE